MSEAPDSEPIKITSLRKNIFAVFDEAAKTGRSVKIEKNGEIFTLLPPVNNSKLSKLKKRSLIVGDLDGLENETVWQWESDNGFD